jgi:putative methyltransferase (TIGR04325 family)
MEECRARGLDIYRYGSDLVEMAETELERNIWAVRFLYLHMLHQGLCLRPPWSMVEHFGFAPEATNAKDESWLRNPPLQAAPKIPSHWPDPVENPECAKLHKQAAGELPSPRTVVVRSARQLASRVLKRLSGGRSFKIPSDEITGNYPDWESAVQATTGYSNLDILQKTRAAMLKVKSGEAVYERDSVLFDTIEYSWPVLSGLMSVAAESGSLDVMDVGGSLGSSFFQNRVFLSRLPSVRWNIVEQPEHVRIGKKDFEDDYLRFYDSVESCLEETSPNVVLLSSVLQYFEEPYEFLLKLDQLPIDNVIIDRTPFWPGSEDRLCIQTVPPTIYNASYPIWILSNERFHKHLSLNWHIIAEFESLDRLSNSLDAMWRGMILKRKQTASG